MNTTDPPNIARLSPFAGLTAEICANPEQPPVIIQPEDTVRYLGSSGQEIGVRAPVEPAIETE